MLCHQTLQDPFGVRPFTLKFTLVEGLVCFVCLSHLAPSAQHSTPFPDFSSWTHLGVEGPKGDHQSVTHPAHQSAITHVI